MDSPIMIMRTMNDNYDDGDDKDDVYSNEMISGVNS